MKLSLKTVVAVLLPALLSVPASAQFRAILPGGANPYIGAPVILPSPAINPIAGMRIDLPAPRLNPGLAVTLAPAPAPSAAVAIMGVFPILPIPMIPSRPVVPVVRPAASRENVAHPLAPILPDLRAQFGTAEKNNDWQKELAEGLFDGRLIPARKPAPVRPSVRVTLPEADLEAEIGAY